MVMSYNIVQLSPSDCGVIMVQLSPSDWGVIMVCLFVGV